MSASCVDSVGHAVVTGLKSRVVKGLNARSHRAISKVTGVDVD